MHQISVYDISNAQILLYNIPIVLSFLYLLFKYRSGSAHSLIVCLFFYGLFVDISRVFTGGRLIVNVYQILLLIWAVKIFLHRKQRHSMRHQCLVLVFLIYAVYYFHINILYHGDSTLLVISQFSKTLIPVLLFPEIDIQINRGYGEKLYNLFYQLLLFQMLFGVWKLVFLGGFLEGWVGSISGLQGGGAGTSLPLLGLIFWSIKSHMAFRSRKDWLFVGGLLLIGFAAGKRAVWVLFPLLFLLLFIVAYGKTIKPGSALMVLILLPVFVYLGVRLTPTLNPEDKVWGSFNPQYAWEYALKYSTGSEGGGDSIEKGVGRVGAVSLMLDMMKSSDESVLFGRGLEYMVYADHDDYLNADYYQGITSRGSITGIVSTFFTIGTIGVVLFILFICTLLLLNKSRYRWVLLIMVLFDYVFYNAQSVSTMALFALAIFLTIYTNYHNYSPNSI